MALPLTYGVHLTSVVTHECPDLLAPLAEHRKCIGIDRREVTRVLNVGIAKFAR